jgi:hypothetical protein
MTQSIKTVYEGQDDSGARIESTLEELVPGEDGAYVKFNVTHEGLIIDIVNLHGEIIGTRAETFDDIVFDCILAPTLDAHERGEL